MVKILDHLNEYASKFLNFPSGEKKKVVWDPQFIEEEDEAEPVFVAQIWDWPLQVKYIFLYFYLILLAFRQLFL